MYVCEISKFVRDTYIIISNQVTEVEMTLHTAFINLCRYMHQLPAKEMFFVSYTDNKTKHTTKKNQYMVFLGYFCRNRNAAWNVRRPDNKQKQYEPL